MGIIPTIHNCKSEIKQPKEFAKLNTEMVITQKKLFEKSV